MINEESADTVHSRDVLLHQSILKEFNFTLASDSMILDFGCGAGGMVREYRRVGFEAFGADVALRSDAPFVREISSEGGYRIPFDDNTFDFVFSNSVLEHVNNLSTALAEIHRVLKAGGASLHLFPARTRLIEPHVFVPFGGILQSRPWLMLWALLGVRNRYQKELDFGETARRNFVYLHDRTFYRPKRELAAEIYAQFGDLTFADKEMIKHSYGRARLLLPLVGIVPFLPALYGNVHNRCLFFRKPTKAGHQLI